MQKITYEEFKKKLQTGIVYFINTFEDAAIRSYISGDTLVFHVKFKGEQEFKAQSDNKLVTDAILEHTELTREEYDNF